MNFFIFFIVSSLFATEIFATEILHFSTDNINDNEIIKKLCDENKKSICINSVSLDTSPKIRENKYFKFLYFDGNDFLEMKNYEKLNTNKLTYFIVFKQKNIKFSNIQNLLRTSYKMDIKNSSKFWGTFLKNDTIFSHVRNKKGQFISLNQGVSIENWHVLSVSWANGKLKQWIDGDYYAGASNLAEEIILKNHSLLRIGANADLKAKEFFNGYIAEIIILNEDMTSDTSNKRKSIENQLLEKYINKINLSNKFAEFSFNNSLIFKRKKEKNFYRIPKIFELPNGDIIVESTLKLGSNRDHGVTEKKFFKISKDDGVTWESFKISEEFNIPAVLDIKSKKMFLFESIYPKFTINGKNFSERYNVNNSRKSIESGSKIVLHTYEFKNNEIKISKKDMTNKFFIYPNYGVVNFFGRGIQLKIGKYKDRILIPCRFYGKKFKNVGKNAHNAIIYSDNHGKSWKWGGVTQGFTGEGNLIELSNGNILFINRNHNQKNSGYRSFAISKDGGVAFTEFGIYKDLPSPRVYSSLARYSYEPSIILFSSPSISIRGRTVAPLEGRRNMSVFISYDEGKSWKQKIIDNSKSGYSDMIVTKNGTIICVYETGDKSFAENIKIFRIKLDKLR
jgi:sialidase-1